MIRLPLRPYRWVRERALYLAFKIRQWNARRRAAMDDPNIYPLW